MSDELFNDPILDAQIRTSPNWETTLEILHSYVSRTIPKPSKTLLEKAQDRFPILKLVTRKRG